MSTWKGCRLTKRTFNTALICLSFCLSGCVTGDEPSLTKIDESEMADQESFDAILTTTSNGKLSSVIKYGRMLRYSKKRLIKFFDGIELHLYEDGVHSSQINARRAEMNEQNDEIDFFGDVRVYADNSISLKSERLLWKTQLDSVTSDTFVTLVTASRDTLYGVGFASGKSFRNWVIKKPFGVTQKKMNLGVVDDEAEK